jgi:hypothetical protein
VSRLLAACAEASITLEHHLTGRITYLDDREDHYGEQVELSARDLADLLQRRLDGGRALTFQLWADAENDVVCEASDCARWDAYCFDFSLDGFTPAEGAEAAERLFRARTRLDDVMKLWLEDRVGMTVEYGPPHEWDGEHAPAWPVPPIEGDTA